MGVLILSHATCTPRSRREACAEAMAAVLAEHARGGTYLPLRSVIRPPGAAGFMGLMPGWRGRSDGSRQDAVVRAEGDLHHARQPGPRPRRASGARSRCSTARPACRPRSSTPPRSPTSAPPRSPRSRPGCWRATTRGRWRSWGPGCRRGRTCGPSRTCAASSRSASTRRPRRTPGPSSRRRPWPARELSVAASAEEAVRGADVVVAVTNSRGAGARSAPGSRREPTSTRSAPAPCGRASSTARRWPRARCSATAASRSATRPASSRARSPRARSPARSTSAPSSVRCWREWRRDAATTAS